VILQVHQVGTVRLETKGRLNRPFGVLGSAQRRGYDTGIKKPPFGGLFISRMDPR
jgi:hypothetical protein